MGNLKKITALSMALVLILTFAACGKQTEEETPIDNLVVMVTDESGLGNGGINDLSWEGCDRAKEAFDVNVYCISATSQEGYMEAMRQAASMEPMLIIAVGSKLEAAVMDVAAANKDLKFAILGSNELGDNVMGVTFKDQEAAFLAGIAAGMTTESKVVGFIGSVRSIEQDSYEYGFDAGVATARADIYVVKNYIDTYVDAAEAKKVAVAQNALGADIIYSPTDAAAAGVTEAASEKGFATVCTGEADETALCSTIKRADFAVYNIIKLLTEGKFDGKDVSYGLKEGGIEISDENDRLSSEIISEIEKYTELIKDGKLTVPYDWQTYNAYQTGLRQ